MGPQGQIKLWNAALLLQSWKLVNDRRRRKSGRPGKATWQIYNTGVKTYWNVHVTSHMLLLISPVTAPVSSCFTPTGAHTPVRAGVVCAEVGIFPHPHEYKLQRQPAAPAILIVISSQPWYEQKGRPLQNLALQRLPPPVLQVACLFGWSTGVGEPEKRIGKAVWILGWNEFDGLIVAPSGHRRTSQRTGVVGE